MNFRIAVLIHVHCLLSVLACSSGVSGARVDTDSDGGVAVDVSRAADVKDSGIVTVDAVSEALDAGPRVELDWVRIEGGQFLMGPDPMDDDDYWDPAFEVTIPTFDLMRTEVTVSAFAMCVDSGACDPPIADEPRFCTFSQADSGGLPVDCVGWHDAQDFARWVGGGTRLPTDSEWEYAARGRGKDWKYSWGDEEATCDRAIMRDADDRYGCGRNGPWPPCSRPAGNTPEGLCDMMGNVYELVEDYFHPNTTACVPIDGSPCLEPAEYSMRVLRSALWAVGPELLEARNRTWTGEWQVGFSGVGFRLARPVAPRSWRRPPD